MRKLFKVRLYRPAKPSFGMITGPRDGEEHFKLGGARIGLSWRQQFLRGPAGPGRSGDLSVHAGAARQLFFRWRHTAAEALSLVGNYFVFFGSFLV